jgi:para-nitrobenzyl esterase
MGKRTIAAASGAMWGAILAAGSALASPITTPTPVIRTTIGPIQGFEQSGIANFLGIPYAQPPVGPMRWKAPVAPVPATTTLQTTTFGNFCPQGLSELSVGGGSEDCLYLNVQAPSAATASSNLPVMFWIHGGGLTTGSGQEYNGSSLVQTGNVIVVTFNYRLGLLGFLAHPALAAEDTAHHSSGNYGTQDQQLALAWVRANIAKFGGNPNNITVFGESAGGQSTITQLVSPTAPKFSRAIIESGAYARTYPTQSGAQQAGASFAAGLGCTGTTAAAAVCLRDIPAATLVADADASTFNVTIAPNVDGYVLTQQPFAAIAAGAFAKVPVIDGTNHDEYRLFVSEQDLFEEIAGEPVGYTAAGYVDFISNEGPGYVSQILGQYPLSDYASPNYAVAAVATDYAFSCGALVLDALLSQHTTVYSYEFNDPNPPNILLVPDPYMNIQDSHAIELEYLFPQYKNITLNLGPAQFSTAQSYLSAGMQASWTSFARYGRPFNPRGGAWLPYSVANHNFTSRISPSQRVITGFYDDHQCGFWGPAILAEAGLPPTTPY